jgi:flavin reductase (DIM6/NTAB) family NADH-FMN oxidoreductase RutF
VSISSEHPFLPPESQRDPLRRFRGRMPQPVTLWCASHDGRQAGWTVSSLIVADGQPAEVLGLIDPDSDLADLLPAAGRVAVSLLGWQHRALGDVFAGLAPAPGGMFRMGAWEQTPWGPVLAGAAGWVGADEVAAGTHLGWGLLVRARVAHIHLGELPAEGLLTHVRGRYRAVPTG